MRSIVAAACAGNERESERDEMFRRYLEFPSLVKGGSVDPHWRQDGASFWYAASEDPESQIWLVDPARDSRVPLDAPPSGREFEPGAYPSPNGDWVAFKRDRNVFVRSSDGSQTVQLTQDGSERVWWAGYFGGRLYWSPDGSTLAVSREDYADVPCSPIVDWLVYPAAVTCNLDTVTGEPWPQTDVVFFDVATRRSIQVSPEAGFYLDTAEAGWRGDSSELLAVTRNRSGSLQRVVGIDPQSGRLRRLLDDSKVVRGPRVSRDFLHPVGDGSGFLWLSERDDWNHIYFYDYDGNLVRQLTRGDFPVLAIVEIDAEGRWVYFTGHDDRSRPYDTHLYRVSLEGGEHRRLTENEGQHAVEFSPSKEFYIDTHSSVNRPPTVELRKADGELLQILSAADVSALDQLKRVPPEEFTVKASDGDTDLYGVLYKPYDFDPDRKYPVIDFIYGGASAVDMQREFVPWHWTEGSWAVPEAFAQLGFITFAVENRGTPERGRKFHEPYPGEMGRHEIPDHVAALRQLAERRRYLDLERVGIYGWSSGGQYAMRALLQAPDAFHVAVAQAPSSELFHTPGYAEELFLGTPQESPDAYEYASNLWLADQLQGKLLIIQGTSDGSVLFGEVMRMVDALIKADKHFDLIVLPGEAHAPSEKVRPYLRDAIRGYFERHLKPGQNDTRN
jgi:dipeptidyl aminopeptidase/acylaminoacyl peptidase